MLSTNERLLRLERLCCAAISPAQRFEIVKAVQAELAESKKAADRAARELNTRE